jgi:hypothetical protein
MFVTIIEAAISAITALVPVANKTRRKRIMKAWPLCCAWFVAGENMKNPLPPFARFDIKTSKTRKDAMTDQRTDHAGG